MDFLFGGPSPSNKQAKKESVPQYLPQNAEVAEISLPKLVKCKSKFNCNLWGRDDLLGLCTECYREYDSRLRSSTKKDIINWLLEKQGLKNLNEACEAYAKELVYPKEEIVDPKKIKGVLTWKTHYRPKTQYDVIPVKGHSACTYISGCAVLVALLANDEPDPEVWKSCITKGVHAFHSAREVDKALAGHVNVAEILGYLLVALNVDTKQANFIEQRATYCMLCSSGLDESQKQNLLATGTLFSILELTEYFRGALANDWSGIVITRPPETWSVIRGSHGQVYLRDSHRLMQYDFKSLETFINFVEVDNAFFVSMPGMGIGGNQLSLTEIKYNQEAMNQLENDMNLVSTGNKPMEHPSSRLRRVLSIDHHRIYGNIGRSGSENSPTLPTEIIKDRLYISDVHIARDFNSLQCSKISHILNLTGPGRNGHPKYLNKFESDFSENKKNYLHICATYESTPSGGDIGKKGTMLVDVDQDGENRTVQLNEYIDESLKFIRRALRSDPRHRVLVHCETGTNLSAGIVVAYLLAETNQTLKSALGLLSGKLIANNKKIQPESGTLMQLLPIERSMKQINTNSISMMEIKVEHVIERLRDMGFQPDRVKVESHLKNYTVNEVEALLVEEAIVVADARR